MRNNNIYITLCLKLVMTKKGCTREEIKMISAISEAFKFKKTNPKADSESILKHISGFVQEEKTHDSKMAMIAAVSKAVSISEKYNFLSDKEIIRKVMPELKEIIAKID